LSLSSDEELSLSSLLLLLLLLLLDWDASTSSSLLLLWSPLAFLLSLVFLVLVILEGDGHVGLSLLRLEELEDEEAVVSELLMCWELLMDLFLQSVVGFSLPLLFGCSSNSDSWLMVLDL
jgi:hypothetical protein